MAIEVLTDVTVSLGGTVVSGIVEVEINDGQVTLDRGVFSDAAVNSGGGLDDPSIKVTGFADYGVSPALYVVAKALQNSNVAIIINRDSTTGTGATNPSWHLTGYLGTVPVLAAKVGEDPMMTLEFKGAGTALSEKVA